jgi:hypothetical protein
LPETAFEEPAEAARIRRMALPPRRLQACWAGATLIYPFPPRGLKSGTIWNLFN